MEHKINRRLHSTYGTSLLEYILILAVIVLTLLVFMTDIGTHINTILTTLGLELNAALLNLK